MLAVGSDSERPAETPARFAAGDPVITRNIHPTGHTRLPRYTRGKRGVIERVHGAHVFPDSNAHGLGEAPQWLYTVRFTGAELWGEDADPTLTTSIDAWDSYLEPAACAAAGPDADQQRPGAQPRPHDGPYDPVPAGG